VKRRRAASRFRNPQLRRCVTKDRVATRELGQLDVFYTLPEVAQLFRRAPRTIRGWVRQGRLIAVRFGRALYFRRTYIDGLIASLQQEDF
jgi:hypothetical protein